MDPASFSSFQEEFDHLFSEHLRPLAPDVLKEYRDGWRRPLLKIPEHRYGMVPEGPQVSALNALRRTRSEGMDKALVVAATGVGKTFIAAKDSEQFGRILFVAPAGRSSFTRRRRSPRCITGRPPVS